MAAIVTNRRMHAGCAPGTHTKHRAVGVDPAVSEFGLTTEPVPVDDHVVRGRSEHRDRPGSGDIEEETRCGDGTTAQIGPLRTRRSDGVTSDP